jgi:hypothetical protein
MSTIIVGSNHINTAEYYKTLGITPSVLVDTINHGHEIGHTCIQDVPDHDTLETILKNASEVYWAESDKNEFFDDVSYYNFLNWLKEYNLIYHNVKNFDTIKFDPYLWNTLQLTLTDQDLVFLGSSTTGGAGIADPADQYANIVATHFNKNPVNLAKITKSVGTNDKLFHLFFQLDFVPEQMVVVHLAPLMRIRYCTDSHQLIDMQLAQPELPIHKEILQVYTKEFLFYNLVVNVTAMIKFAREKKLKLVFLLDDYKQGSISTVDQLYFYEFPEYIPPTQLQDDIYTDVGTDNLHPGILSNKAIATHIINHMETLYK